MPVDAGIMNAGLDLAPVRGGEPLRADDLLETAETLGWAFRLRREARGLNLDQLSLSTRIRPQYLAAIEASRLDELPSGPFAIGYVRAYASALGLDPEQAAARYRRDAPDRDHMLAAPVGVDREGDPHFRLLVTLGVLVVCAILAWNIVQRVMAGGAARQHAQAVAVARPANSSRAPIGPVALGAPLPPPQESTTPEPYITPGLGTTPTGAAAVVASVLPAAGTPFEGKGPVYGARAANAAIILQAVKPASLVVRGGDGTVYFARQLEAGESYAAPALQGLSVEASNPAVVAVYVGRVLKGPLPAAMTSLSSLTSAASH